MFDIATTRILHRTSRDTGSLRDWCWPLARIDDHAPSILEADAHDTAVYLGYTGDPKPKGFVPVLAARDGIITYAARIETAGATPRYTMCLDHAGGWSTRYGDLEHMFAVPTDRFARRRKARVSAGDVLGYAQRAPLRVRFELWRVDDEGVRPIVATEPMRAWLVLPWPTEPAARTRNEAA